MNQNNYLRNLNTGLPKDILAYKQAGYLDKALELIEKRLEDPSILDSLKESLLVQKEMISRIPSNYPYSLSQALEIIKKHIPDYTLTQLQEALDRRRTDWVFINGEIHLLRSFYENLCKYPDFEERTLEHRETTIKDFKHYQTVQEIMKDKNVAYRIKIRSTIKVKEEAFHKGKELLVHLPIPKPCDSQSDIVIEKVYPKEGIIGNESDSQRTICWQMKMPENQEFFVEFSYTSKYSYLSLDRKGSEKEYNFRLQQQLPHIQFSPFIKEVANSLTQGTADPLEKAKKVYDYITTNMSYGFQPDYILMDNIPETCLKTLRGDCGVFALTMITLLRYLGIPAYWESGSCLSNNEVHNHDWLRFYVEPYGWLYADPSFGVGCNTKGYQEGREYYFGHLDPYRMIANDDFEKEFFIEKKYFRHDPYDNQTGEVEDQDHALIKDVEYESRSELLELRKL